MRKKSILFQVAAVLAVVALLVTACGGGGQAPAGQTGAGPTTAPAAAAPTTAPAAAAPTTAPAAAAPTTEPAAAATTAPAAAATHHRSCRRHRLHGRQVRRHRLHALPVVRHRRGEPQRDPQAAGRRLRHHAASPSRPAIRRCSTPASRPARRPTSPSGSRPPWPSTATLLKPLDTLGVNAENYSAVAAGPRHGRRQVARPARQDRHQDHHLVQPGQLRGPRLHGARRPGTS